MVSLLLPESFSGSLKVLKVDVDDGPMTTPKTLRIPVESPDGPLTEVWNRDEELNASVATYRFARIDIDDQDHRD